MWLFGVLVVAYGALGTACGSSCMYATLQCSGYKAVTVPHKNLAESEEDLDKICRQEACFYKCLDNLLTCDAKITKRMLMHPVLEQAKFLSNELCSKESIWRKKYLDVAPCINSQFLDFCTSQEFMYGNEMTGCSPNRCYLRQKAIHCITTTLTVNCNTDAADMFHYLLRMTPGGGVNCDMLGSEVLLPCQISSFNATDQGFFYGGTIVTTIVKTPEQTRGTLTSDPALVPEEQFYQVDPSVILVDRVGNYVDRKTEETIADGTYSNLMGIIGNIPERDDALSDLSLIRELELMDGYEFERKTKETIADDIYNSFMNRINSIPEQNDAALDSFIFKKSHEMDSSILRDRMEETIESKTETIVPDVYNSLMDRIGNIPEQNDGTLDSFQQFYKVHPSVLLGTVGKSLAESEMKQEIGNAIAMALDSLDNSESEITRGHADNRATYATEENDGYINQRGVNRRPRSIFSPEDEEDMKYFATFKHNDGRVSFYIRKRGYHPMQSFNCSYKENITSKDFHCSFKYRMFDPVCRRYTFDSDSERPIVPKDIDPELGAVFHIPWPVKEYPFTQFLNVSSVLTDPPLNNPETASTKNGISVETAEQESTPDYTPTIESLLVKMHAPDSYRTDVPVEASEYLEPSTHRFFEETPDDLSRESVFTEQTTQSEDATLGYFAKVISTASQTTTERSATTTSLPSIVQDEFDNLFRFKNFKLSDPINSTDDLLPEKLRFLNAEYSFSEYGDYDIYWRDIKGDTLIEAIVCGRVNECHPFAKFVFKCTLAYNHKEICDNCKSRESQTSVGLESSQDFQKEAEVGDIGSGDYTTFIQGSNLSEYLAITENPVSTVYFAEETINSNELVSASYLVNSEDEEELVQMHIDSTGRISNLKSPTEGSDAEVDDGIRLVMVKPEYILSMNQKILENAEIKGDA